MSVLLERVVQGHVVGKDAARARWFRIDCLMCESISDGLMHRIEVRTNKHNTMVCRV